MRIGIMLRSIHEKQGIGVYTLNLMDHLLLLNRSHEYVLFYSDREFFGRYASYANVREQIIRAPSKLFWDQVLIPLAARRVGVDVIFNTKFTVPLLTRRKSSMVLHGSEWFVYPKVYKLLDRLNIKLMMPLYTRRADLLIANSKMTKRDFVHFLGVDERKIHSVYFGVNRLFQPIEESSRLEAVRQKYHLPARFILNVARFYPGKNFANLFSAFQKVYTEIPHDLVIVGHQRYGLSEELARLDRLGLAKRVQFAGWIPHEDLAAVYNLADMMVFPSLYEAFGMVLLEAMACGCPVIASNTGALPEVGGDAAYYVDPNRSGEIADAMRTVLTDEACRRRLVDAGLARAREFSWEQCARETLDLLESLADEHGTSGETTTAS